MFCKRESQLIGIKFLDHNESPLLENGHINDPMYLNHEYVEIKELELKEGERLIGV